MTFSGLFQIWEYTVSHGCLLLRRNIDEHGQSRIELFFWNTNYIDLPTTLNGLTIRELQPEAVTDELRTFTTYGDRVFELISDGRTGIVVSAGYEIDESFLSHSEPSRFWNRYKLD